MSGPPTTADPANGEVPPAVARRERRLVAALAASVAAFAVFGIATVPSDAELLERASTADDGRDRVRAMNALVLRGYWEERPLAELRHFLDESPPDLREFVERMHGSLLRQR